jgi:hypothetical protein
MLRELRLGLPLAQRTSASRRMVALIWVQTIQIEIDWAHDSCDGCSAPDAGQ